MRWHRPERKKRGLGPPGESRGTKEGAIFKRRPSRRGRRHWSIPGRSACKKKKINTGKGNKALKQHWPRLDTQAPRRRLVTKKRLMTTTQEGPNPYHLNYQPTKRSLFRVIDPNNEWVTVQRGKKRGHQRTGSGEKKGAKPDSSPSWMPPPGRVERKKKTFRKERGAFRGENRKRGTLTRR